MMKALEHLRNNRITQPLIHLLVWILVLAFFLYADTLVPAKGPGFRKMIALFVITAGVFYVNYALLIPKLLFEKRLALYVLCVLALILLLGWLLPAISGPSLETALPGAPRMGPGRSQRPPGAGPMRLFPMVIWTLAVLTGLVVRVTQRWLTQDAVSKSIQADQVKSELIMLKSQVSPHFLFNTLNNIYALTETDPKQAQAVIHQLSKMMRYMLYESEKNYRMPLSRELDFIAAYIDLMKKRLPDATQVVFTPPATPQEGYVPPLLFIAFVENAFKHGVSAAHTCSIHVDLKAGEEHVVCTVENDIIKQPQSMEEGGIGLSNAERRLELIYGKGNFELQVTQSSKYTVQLKIPLWH